MYKYWLTMKNGMNEKQGKSSKESKPSMHSKISLKEDTNGEFYSEGYIATTHIDSVNDMILPETLYHWADVINSTSEGTFQANPMSIHHDRSDIDLAGIGQVARVDKLSDGEYGLFVSTHHNKSHPEFEKTKYEIDNDFLTHYSIEYDTLGGLTTESTIKNGKEVRIIKPETELYGYGLASPRTVVNPKATIVDFGYKELYKKSEETKMVENKETKEQDEKVSEEKPASQAAETTSKPVETNLEEPGMAESKPSKSVVEDKEKLAMKSELESKEKTILELKSKIEANKPMLNAGAKMENKEKLTPQQIEMKEVLTQFKEGVIDKKASLDERWRIAAKTEMFLKEHGKTILSGSELVGVSSATVPFEIKENRIELKENRLEFKNIDTDSDYVGQQTSYLNTLINYEQTPARYNDLYGSVIVDQLNSETMFWNKLTKENASGMSAIRIRARTGRNGTAGSYNYGSTPGWDSHAAIDKFNLHFVTSYVEVKVEDEAQELSNAPGGVDAWANEIKFAILDLGTYLNQAIFQTGDGTAENVPMGFDGGLIRVAGDLYGKDVSSVTTLAAAGKDAMSSASLTLKKLREMIRKSEINGARRSDLVFVTSYLQHDFIKALYHAQQIIAPTSGRVGFTGVLSIDDIPIFPEKDLDALSMTDDVFLIDIARTKVAIKKAPTYVEFAKVDLNRKGIIWMMWNMYSDAPNHNYHINGLAVA
uniref:Capsid protein n=1 Tax=viral metagenome TaxID=1070528 RepID=A0A6M3LI43_9ZZZZ